MTKDPFTEITQAVIDSLEAGTKPWVRPWNTKNTFGMPMRSNGEAYRGINILLLWISAMKNNFNADSWMTYKQAAELGGQVKKGSRGSLVMKYGTFKPKEADNQDATEIPYSRGYKVFNVEQIEGLPETYYPAPLVVNENFKPIERVEQLVTTIGAKVHWNNTSAFYAPSKDEIFLPPRETFHDEAGAYATLLHELGHWTAAKHRLDRNLKGRFGDEAYAMEELIAEMASAFLCAKLNVPHNPGDQTAAYVANWVTVLKNDKKAIVTAASSAQSIVDYVLNLEAKTKEKAA